MSIQIENMTRAAREALAAVFFETAREALGFPAPEGGLLYTEDLILRVIGFSNDGGTVHEAATSIIVDVTYDDATTCINCAGKREKGSFVCSACNCVDPGPVAFRTFQTADAFDAEGQVTEDTRKALKLMAENMRQEVVRDFAKRGDAITNLLMANMTQAVTVISAQVDASGRADVTGLLGEHPSVRHDLTSGIYLAPEGIVAWGRDPYNEHNVVATIATLPESVVVVKEDGKVFLVDTEYAAESEGQTPG